MIKDNLNSMKFIGKTSQNWQVAISRWNAESGLKIKQREECVCSWLKLSLILALVGLICERARALLDLGVLDIWGYLVTHSCQEKIKE